MKKYQVKRNANGNVTNFPGLDGADPHVIVSNLPDAEVERLANNIEDELERQNTEWNERLETRNSVPRPHETEPKP